MSSSPLYAPLPTPTSTRVIALAPGTFGESLHATLLIIDLADLPAPPAQPIELIQTVQHVLYEAISYTWGPPPTSTNPDKTVNLSGHDISIRLNLYQCLQRLRHESQQRRFWIDALSISQTDLKEKGKQVAMIGRIFGGAEMVRVWVGEEADGSSELFGGWKDGTDEGEGVREVEGVFERMVGRVRFKDDYDTDVEEEEEDEADEDEDVADDEVGSYSNENDQDVDSESEEGDSSESEVEDEPESEEDVNTVAGDTGIPDLTKEQQKHRLAVWAAFLARPYFSRYWILQEVCIAKNIRVHCGSSSLSWQRLFSGFFRQYMSISWIWERSAKGCEVDVHGTGNWQPFSGYANRVNQVHDLRGLQRQDRLRKTAESRALFTLMARFEDSECEDRRDRMYAIMSLEERESSTSSPRPAMEPDYEISVPELWLSVSEQRLLGLPFSQMDHLHDAQSVLERSFRPKSAEYEQIFDLFVERCEHAKTDELREQWRHMATRYVGDVVERLGKRGWDQRPGEDLEYESALRIDQKVKAMGLPVPRRGPPPNRT